LFLKKQSGDLAKPVAHSATRFAPSPCRAPRGMGWGFFFKGLELRFRPVPANEPPGTLAARLRFVSYFTFHVLSNKLSVAIFACLTPFCSQQQTFCCSFRMSHAFLLSAINFLFLFLPVSRLLFL
jgi:hypothetical protein